MFGGAEPLTCFRWDLNGPIIGCIGLLLRFLYSFFKIIFFVAVFVNLVVCKVKFLSLCSVDFGEEFNLFDVTLSPIDFSLRAEFCVDDEPSIGLDGFLSWIGEFVTIGFISGINWSVNIFPGFFSGFCTKFIFTSSQLDEPSFDDFCSLLSVSDDWLSDTFSERRKNL